MRKKPTKYTHEERLALLREYHESGMSKYRFAKEKGFSSQIMLSVWIKKYESEEKSLVLPSEESEKDMAQKSMEQNEYGITPIIYFLYYTKSLDNSKELRKQFISKFVKAGADLKQDSILGSANQLISESK